jgi:hypothetical protein
LSHEEHRENGANEEEPEIAGGEAQASRLPYSIAIDAMRRRGYCRHGARRYASWAFHISPA